MLILLSILIIIILSMSMRNFLENIKQIMSDAYSVVVQMDLSTPQQIYRIWTINKVVDENYKNFSGLRCHFKRLMFEEISSIQRKLLFIEIKIFQQ